MNPAVMEFEESVKARLPEAYYDVGQKEYLVSDDHKQWMPLTETQFKRVLRGCGIGARVDGTGLSPQDKAILEFQKRRNVAWAGPLAGYGTGIHEMCGTRVLVTTSPKIIEPVAGEWPTLRKVIGSVLDGQDGVQVAYFLAWLKVAYEALRAGRRQPGQAVVMCGPHGCGKSLLQQLVTEVLGGRVAKPYQVMTGGTGFNADLFGAEHLCIEDEQPSTDIRARRAFGSQIKNVTVAVDQRMHPKHRNALVLRPFWRITVSINDEQENLMVLPPLDDSLEDKLMIFRAARNAMPMPTGTAVERDAFWGQLVRELPAMLAYLVEMDIPMEMRSERFGVRHYQHPEILRMLNEVAPEFRLLALLDAVLFQRGGTLAAEPSQQRQLYVGTAETIGSLLTMSCSGYEHEARRLLSWNNACGTYLGRLAKALPERVREMRSGNARQWLIMATGDKMDTAAGAAPAAGSECGTETRMTA